MEITPSEIQPYVAIGPSRDYSISVHKSTFDFGFMAFTIVFGLTLIIIVAVVIIIAYNVSRPPPIPQTIKVNKSTRLTPNSNYGAVPYPSHSVNGKIDAPNGASALSNKELCLSQEHTEWIADKCFCTVPFFGETCQQEKHYHRYFAVGVPNESNLALNVIDNLYCDGKSFPSKRESLDSCSNYCDRNEDCHGFIYHQPNSCTLLTGDVVVPRNETITYSHNVDSTLYMTNSNDLHFEGRIFLGEHTWSFPARYWLFSESEGYVQLLPNTIKKIEFSPNYIKMYTPYTGIYCLHSFSHKDIPLLLEYGDPSRCYVHKPESTLNLPEDFKYKTPLYVVYI